MNDKLIIHVSRIAKSTWLCFGHCSLWSFVPLFILIMIFSTTFTRPSHGAEVTLAWDDNDAVVGYYLYYGFESRNYSFKIDVGPELQYTLFNLDDMETYYFAVTAYNENGESDFSDEIVYAAGGCEVDIDFDGDIDGSNLFDYTEDTMGVNLEIFAAKFGSMRCPY